MGALKPAFCLAAVLLLGAGSAPLPVSSSNTLFAPAAAKQLNRGIDAIVRRNNLPSVALGIFVPGRGRYTFVEGYANLGTWARRTLDQPFRIASITKPFAATAVLTLVDRGLLHKTDPIAKWYPDFPHASEITVDDLLRMRSGIPAPNDSQVLARVYDAPLARAPALETEMASFARLRSRFKPPNSVGIYTDFNYDILAGIVKRVSGKDIGDLITQSVIQPLSLRHTSYPRGVTIPGPLRGYGWNVERRRFDDKTLFNPPLAGAAGAVVSNVNDLLIFSRALCVDGVLKRRTREAQLRGAPLEGSHADYGEGVALGQGVCGHSGTINGFSTDMYYFRRANASLVISVNRLDRNNELQTSPILALVGKAIGTSLAAYR